MYKTAFHLRQISHDPLQKTLEVSKVKRASYVINFGHLDGSNEVAGDQEVLL